MLKVSRNTSAKKGLRLFRGRIQEVYLPAAKVNATDYDLKPLQSDLQDRQWTTAELLEWAQAVVADVAAEDAKGMLSVINGLVYQWARCHQGIKEIEDHSEFVSRRIVSGTVLQTAWTKQRWIPLVCAWSWVQGYATKWHGIDRGRRWWGNIKARMGEWFAWSTVSVQSKGKVPTTWLLDVPRLLHVARELYAKLQGMIQDGHAIELPRHDYWMLRQIYQAFSGDMTWGEHGQYNDIPLQCDKVEDAMSYRRAKGQRGFAKGFGVVAVAETKKGTKELVHKEAHDSYAKEVALLEEWESLGTATKELKERAVKIFFEREVIDGPKPPLNHMTVGLAVGDYTDYYSALNNPNTYLGIHTDPELSVLNEDPLLYEAEDIFMDWASWMPGEAGDKLVARTKTFLENVPDKYRNHPAVSALRKYARRK